MMSVKIVNQKGKILEESKGGFFVDLIYKDRYWFGNSILVETDRAPCHLLMQLDDAMEPALVYLKNSTYRFPIPFLAKKIPYNPKAFRGRLHRIKIRESYSWETEGKRNLCLNPYDTADNDSCYPHAKANVETRNSPMFAAKNAINGNTQNRKHGIWPYESWGINRNPNAEITVEFGRCVIIEKIVLWIRADFPHDSWWKQGKLFFPDGSSKTLVIAKSYLPQEFAVEKKTVTWIKLGELLKDENDPSPYPALTQIEAYGYEG
jgi:hypothetical protein